MPPTAERGSRRAPASTALWASVVIAALTRVVGAGLLHEGQREPATEPDLTKGVRAWPAGPLRAGSRRVATVLRFVSSLEAASEGLPQRRPFGSGSYWTRNGSQTVRSTSGTGPRQRDHLTVTPADRFKGAHHQGL